MKKSLITLSLVLAFTALHAQKKSIVGIWNFAEELLFEFTENKFGLYGSDPSEYEDYYVSGDKIIVQGEPANFKLQGKNTLIIFGEKGNTMQSQRITPSKKHKLKPGIYYTTDETGYDYIVIQDDSNAEVFDRGSARAMKYIVEGSKLYMIYNGLFTILKIKDSETIEGRIKYNDYIFKLISKEKFAERNRYGEIVSAYRQDDYEKAIELALQAIEKNPNDMRFYHILAEIYQAQGDYQKVINILNQSLQIDPQSVGTIGNLSFYYLFVKEYAMAEQMARKALSMDSTQTWINTNLASAILFQDRYEEAKKLFLELQDEDCLSITCAEAWLDDFNQFEKAGVIPENQKQNVRKIRELLGWEEPVALTKEQEQEVIEVVTVWFEEMRKANDINRIMQVSDVPFAFNRKKVINTTGNLKEAYLEFLKDEGQRTIPTYEVVIWDYDNEIVWGYVPINIVRVIVRINEENNIVVSVLSRDNTFKVVGFH